MVDNAPRKAPSRKARKKKAVVDSTRRQKEFLYRGRSITDLREMSLEDFSGLVNSRDRRFIKRCLQGDNEPVARLFWTKVQAAGEGDEVRTHLRNFPILPQFVGKIMAVHNGKEFAKVTVTAEMLGHKLGEFAPTRGGVKHTGPGVGATRSSKFMPLK